MDSEKQATVRFRSSQNNLTIINTGNGHVEAATSPYTYPFNFSCDGVKCAATNVYSPGRVYQYLFPGKDTDIHGVEWECNSTALGCWIMMDDDKKVKINSLLKSTFKNETYLLRVSTAGGGKVEGSNIQGYERINCGAKCEALLPVDEHYYLDAIPADGWTFTGWEGGEGFCSEQTINNWKIGRCNVMAEPNKIVTIKAKFGKTFNLIVNKEGGKDGTVKSSPGGIDCGPGCIKAVQSFPGAVTLTAAPETGAVFGGWGYACSGKGQCQLTGDSDKQVTAYFDECSSHDDCAWNQFCNYYDLKCVDIQCECGEIQNHECVKYECCSEFDCKLYQRCNTQQNKCVELNQCLIHSSEGMPREKLDLVIIGDGFATNADLEKEIYNVVDSKTISGSGNDGLFDISPFKENKHKFNVMFRNVPNLDHKKDGTPVEEDAVKWANTCARDFVVVFSKQKYRPYAIPPSTP